MKEINHIGIIGYEGNNSWTPLIAQALNKMGYLVTQFSVTRIRDVLDPLTKDDYLQKKRPFSIKSAIHEYEDKIDVLLIEQSYMYFNNDVEMPVLYHHTELTTPLTVRNPTHLSMKLPEMENFIHSYFPWEWWNIKYHYYCFPQAFPPHWIAEPDKKDIPVSYIGAPADMFDRKRDWVWNNMCIPMWRVEEYMRLLVHPKLYIYDDISEEPATQPLYNEFQMRSQHMILTAHQGVYFGRRHMECLASKTIPIIWVENSEAKKWLEFIGFKADGKEQNCYFFTENQELKRILDTLEYDPEIAERGYTLLLEHHTPGHRALTIEKILELTTNRLYVKKPNEVDQNKSPVIYKAKSLVRSGP